MRGAPSGRKGRATSRAPPTPPWRCGRSGEYAYLLFCAGLLNASLFAACILPLSTAYTVCEGLGFESGVNKRFREAPIFYWLFTAADRDRRRRWC